jgi:peptidoglycan/LPS O-acetylase OafA/YrhL
MNNNNCFDFLRFFFAFDILLAHLWELSESSSLFFLSRITDSSIAIKGFFVISGFLVAKSYTNTPSLKEYFIKRAKRILPAYIFVILFSTILLSVFSNYSFYNYFTNISTYQYVAWNLVFLNFVHPCLPGIFDNNLLCAVNGALWTLKVEEGFYIILPLVFYLITKFKKPFFILFLIYIASLVYWYIMHFYFNKPLLSKQLPGQMAYFSVGILSYLYFSHLMNYKLKIVLGSVFILILSYYFPLSFSFFYPAALGLIVIISAYSLPIFNNFGKYGDFTYGLYIFHFPVIQLFRQYDLFEKYNPFFIGVLVVLLSFSLAIFSWFVIEKRFLDRYKIRNNASQN